MSINTFFLRISSSCNLNCDYCYVFKHRDAMWRNYPPIMNALTISLFCNRLAEYLLLHDELKEVNIVFHGGEPLVFGKENLIKTIDAISEHIGSQARIRFSLQTNGTLLDACFVDECSKRNVGISLSLDGMECVHDQHRRYKTGYGSYKDVMRGLKLLQRHPVIFAGVIGVIDPHFSPEQTLNFFEDCGIENIDLLLPDSTYLDLPPDRDKDVDIYKHWLLQAFDSWFYKHQSLHYRTNEHLLAALLGEKSTLDAFGLGTLDYLTIETDGSYHTSDILKVAYENASSLGMDLHSNSIEDALASDKVKEYNRLLSVTSLPTKCQQCIYSNICGGGSLPHRYSPENMFDNPTIYCPEMFALIEHAQAVLEQALKDEAKD